MKYKLQLLLILSVVIGSCSSGGGSENPDVRPNSETPTPPPSVGLACSAAESVYERLSSGGTGVEPDTLDFSAAERITNTALWVGDSSSTVLSDESLAGRYLLRAQTENCDGDELAGCQLGQVNQITSLPITDTALTRVSPAYYSLLDFDESLISESFISDSRFSERIGTQLISWQGNYILIGGQGISELHKLPVADGFLNDIWLFDGTAWKLLSNEAGFSKRALHKAIVFDEKIWVIGGMDSEGIKNDIWSSSNGSEWTLELTNAPFSPRVGFEVAVFENKLWLIGGGNNNRTQYNDIWSTEDGVNWVQQAADAAFAVRQDHQLESFNGELWLSFGSNELAYLEWDASSPAQKDHLSPPEPDRLSDIWSSEDGINWELVSETAFEGAAQDKHQMIHFRDRLFLLRGRADNPYSGDIWASADGINWEALNNASTGPNLDENGGPGFHSVREDSQVASNGSELLLIGGASNIVQRSEDGALWETLLEERPATPIQHFTPFVLNNRLILHGLDAIPGGGKHEQGTENWISEDFIHWLKADNLNRFQPNQFIVQFVEHDEKMVALEHVYMQPEGCSSGFWQVRLWSSNNGMDWAAEISGGFPDRFNGSYTSFDRRLWLIGGDVTTHPRNPPTNDFVTVWSSADGQQWQAAATHNELPQRLNAATVVYKQRLWVIGGVYQDSSRNNEVWSSGDGVEWELETSEPQFPPSAGHQLLVFKDKLWMFGGGGCIDRCNRQKEIWSTDNGRDWTLELPQNPFYELKHVMTVGDMLVALDRDSRRSQYRLWRSSNGTDWQRLQLRNLPGQASD